jgi:hypothetical protein
LNAISFTGVSGVQKGGDDTPETNVSARFGAHLKIGLELRYVSTMAAYCNLDGLRDWSHRWVRICICRTSDQGGPTNYPQLSTITGAATGSGAISYDSGWLFTGGGDNIFLTHSFGGSDPDFAFKALESSTGQMQMRIYTNGPVGTADYYWVTVEATDQFVAP